MGKMDYNIASVHCLATTVALEESSIRELLEDYRNLDLPSEFSNSTINIEEDLDESAILYSTKKPDQGEDEEESIGSRIRFDVYESDLRVMVVVKKEHIETMESILESLLDVVELHIRDFSMNATIDADVSDLQFEANHSDKFTLKGFKLATGENVMISCQSNYSKPSLNDYEEEVRNEIVPESQLHVENIEHFDKDTYDNLVEDWVNKFKIYTEELL
ncbi:hypothetical protein U4E84_01705 [Halorubrum sp. AD140]|uniref:hypothetical protein n=1 Tax=Halorubrum sp. AD140 TaxID=3050073 RepID=UPI002ACC8D82|nr:hypothetical protein [Halorubrum sp. AD140]MDZ5810070.1 hypothetical protein [Halorubrum sp. AD140]